MEISTKVLNKLGISDAVLNGGTHEVHSPLDGEVIAKLKFIDEAATDKIIDDTYTLDVSKYNKDIDWNAAGADVCFVKSKFVLLRRYLGDRVDGHGPVRDRTDVARAIGGADLEPVASLGKTGERRG